MTKEPGPSPNRVLRPPFLRTSVPAGPACRAATHARVDLQSRSAKNRRARSGDLFSSSNAASRLRLNSVLVLLAIQVTLPLTHAQANSPDSPPASRPAEIRSRLAPCSPRSVPSTSSPCECSHCPPPRSPSLRLPRQSQKERAEHCGVHQALRDHRNQLPIRTDRRQHGHPELLLRHADDGRLLLLPPRPAVDTLGIQASIVREYGLGPSLPRTAGNPGGDALRLPQDRCPRAVPKRPALGDRGKPHGAQGPTDGRLAERHVELLCAGNAQSRNGPKS